MPHRMFVSLALATLTTTACAKKDDGAAGKAPTTAKPTEPSPSAKPSTPAPATLRAEARTLAIKGFSVDASVPAGWKEGPFGDGLGFQMADKDYNTSTYFISPGCQGSCGAIAENVVGFVDAQRKMHEDNGYQVEVAAQGELPEGGREFRLNITREGTTMVQVVAIRHQAGWDQAVTCSGTMLGEFAAQADLVAGWCRSLKITKL